MVFHFSGFGFWCGFEFVPGFCSFLWCCSIVLVGGGDCPLGGDDCPWECTASLGFACVIWVWVSCCFLDLGFASGWVVVVLCGLVWWDDFGMGGLG